MGCSVILVGTSAGMLALYSMNLCTNNLHRHICAEMCIDISVDACVDVYVDMCIEMIEICTDM